MQKYTHYSITLLVIIFSIILLLSSLLQFHIQAVYGQEINNSINSNDETINSPVRIELNPEEILGIVRNGSFTLVEINETRKLTSVGVVEAISPESGLMNLTQYDGKAIMVSSEQIDDEWLWGATIIDIADPILTKVVKQVYGLQ